MNDLKRQAEAMPALAKAVTDVLASGWYLMGEALKRFEREFAAWCGTSHCVGVANGTDAIELALRALGVRAGDAVAACANAGGYSTTAIHAIGAVPCFVDVSEHDACMNPATLAQALERGTAKAVVVTHLYGRLADVERLADVAARHGVPLVEDCAQAHGAMRGGRKAGSFGTIASFSFYPTKNLGCAGDGGAVVTNDEALATRVQQLRQYGWTSKYETGLEGGRNSRLDEIQAAILSAKLPFVDDANARRRAVVLQYDAGLANPAIRTFARGGEGDVGHLYVVRSANREALRAHLRANGIASDAHYPIPDHRQAAFRSRYAEVSLPVTERLCAEVLSLPCFAELAPDEIARVVDVCNAWNPA